MTPNTSTATCSTIGRHRRWNAGESMLEALAGYPPMGRIGIYQNQSPQTDTLTDIHFHQIGPFRPVIFLVFSGSNRVFRSSFESIKS